MTKKEKREVKRERKRKGEIKMTSSHSMESMIRGYHVYQNIWTPTTGEELQCARELSNLQDPFALAVTKSGIIIGHLPRKISSKKGQDRLPGVSSKAILT